MMPVVEAAIDKDVEAKFRVATTGALKLHLIDQIHIKHRYKWQASSAAILFFLLCHA